MPSNISVAISAETADFQAKLALAQSNVRAFSAETRAAADAIRLAGSAANDDMKVGLDSAAASAAAARAEVTRLKTALAEAAGPEGFTGFRERIINGSVSLRASAQAFTELGEAIGAAFVGERLYEGINRTAELGEGLLKLSRETGVSVSTLSGWRYGAEQMDVSAESLDTGLTRLARNIQTALLTPTSQAAQAFQAAGISQQFLRENSNNTEAVLLKLADAFRDHADGAQAAAVAMAIFGRAGADLVPFLQGGSDAIRAFIDKQKELGANISGATTEEMERYRQSVKDLDAAWQGFSITLTEKVAPALTEVAKGFTRFFSGHGTVPPGTGIIGDEMVMPAQRPNWAPAEAPTPEVLAEASGGAATEAAKKPFGDLTAATNQLEQFRAELEKMRADMTLAGATNDQILAREVAMWKEETTAAAATANEKLQAESSYQAARVSLYRADVAAAKQAEDQKTRATTAAYRQQMELIKGTNDEALAAIKAAHSVSLMDQLQAEAAYWRQIVQMARQGSQQQQEAIKQLGAVTDKIAQEQAEDWTKAARQITDAFTQPVTRAFDTMVSGMVGRTRSWQQTEERAFQQMAQSFVEAVAKMTAEWAGFHAAIAIGGSRLTGALGMTGGPLQTLAGGVGGAGGLLGGANGQSNQQIQQLTRAITGNTTATTQDTQTALQWVQQEITALAQWLGLTTATTASTAATTADATAVTAGATANIGLTASLVANTAALAANTTALIVSKAVPSYAVGTMGVPHDMLAQIHQGEIVVPAALSDSIRGGTAALGGPGAAGGSTGPSISINIANNSVAPQAAQQFFNDPRNLQMIATRVARYVALNPSTQI